MIKRSVLPESWECPQVFRDRLGENAGHQRIMVHQEHLLIILHAPPEADQQSRTGRLFWRKPDGTWQATEKGGKTALVKHLQEFEQILVKLEDQDEHATRSEDYFPVLEQLAPILRSISHLYQVLQEARKAVPMDKDLINYRDKSYQLMRTAELCNASAKNGLEFSIAKKADEQAASAQKMAVAAHRLNLLAGFFFPLVTIASVFGMQLLPIDPAYSTGLFFVLIAVGLICGFLLTLFVSVKSKPAPPEHLPE